LLFNKKLDGGRKWGAGSKKTKYFQESNTAIEIDIISIKTIITKNNVNTSGRAYRKK